MLQRGVAMGEEFRGKGVNGEIVTLLLRVSLPIASSSRTRPYDESYARACCRTKLGRVRTL